MNRRTFTQLHDDAKTIQQDVERLWVTTVTQHSTPPKLLEIMAAIDVADVRTAGDADAIDAAMQVFVDIVTTTMRCDHIAKVVAIAMLGALGAPA